MNSEENTMPIFSDYTFPGNDGVTEIHVRRCTPDGEIRGVVQLAHGIAEHIMRYDPFASFLAEHGFVVVGNDHMGHGQSIAAEDALGFFTEQDGWSTAVSDMHTLHDLTAAEFPGLPYFLFGHSMGSFLTRTYLNNYPTGLSGAIICGTAQMSSGLMQSGRTIGKAEIRRKGAKYHSQMLNNVAFGAYNNGIENKRTAYDWLTRDESVVGAYIADPLCGFIPTAGLFTDMMDGLIYNSRRANLELMNKALPVFFIAGDKDPVGDCGKGVQKAYTFFLNAGMTDVTLKLYHDCRHELLNELCKEQVKADVLAWINTKM